MPYIDNATVLAADRELRYLSRFRTERWPYMRDNCHPPTRPEARVPASSNHERTNHKPSTPSLEDSRPQGVSSHGDFTTTSVESEAHPTKPVPVTVSPHHTPVNRLNKTPSTARSMPRKRISKYSISPTIEPATPVTPQPRLPFKDLVNRTLDNVRCTNPLPAPTPVGTNPQAAKKRRYKYEIID